MFLWQILFVLSFSKINVTCSHDKSLPSVKILRYKFQISYFKRNNCAELNKLQLQFQMYLLFSTSSQLYTLPDYMSGVVTPAKLALRLQEESAFSDILLFPACYP